MVTGDTAGTAPGEMGVITVGDSGVLNASAEGDVVAAADDGDDVGVVV